MTPAPGKTTENTVTRCSATSQAAAVSASPALGPRTADHNAPDGERRDVPATDQAICAASPAEAGRP